MEKIRNFSFKIRRGTLNISHFKYNCIIIALRLRFDLRFFFSIINLSLLNGQ